MHNRKNEYTYMFVCICVLTIAMATFMFSIRTYQQVSNKIIDFDSKNVESLYLRVTDVYGVDNNESLSDFFSESDSLERMKAFNKILNSTFNYLEFDTQSLLVNDETQYKDEFRIDYGKSYFGSNDKVGISLKSAQIGKRTYDSFSIENQLSDGSGFDSNDFVFNNKTIPAIMGHEYTKSVKIGDTLKFNYLTKNIFIKVVGFLKKDASVAINNNIYFLDRYIVIPSLEVNFKPAERNERDFQNILFSLKNWGYIKVNTGQNYAEFKNEIDSIATKYNLKYIVNEGFVYPYIKNISNTMHSSKGVLLIAAIFLFLVLSIIFAYINCWSFDRNKKAYAIHLICGCSLNRLKRNIYLEILLQVTISFASAVIINTLLLGRDFNYISERILLGKAISQTVTITIIMTIMICLILNPRLNKSNICASIQNED